MLRFLGVRHLAVIDHLEVEFEPGLNVLTGETGAGKSILVGAIDLLLGGRASTDLVRTGEATATIQAVFEHRDGREVIVRREVSSSGRSRAFIDDALATAGALRELAAGLVDLHGQHEHQALLDPAEHVDLLDAFVDGADTHELASRFDAWKAAAAALERTKLDDREKRARIEMASFHLQEIERVAPQPEEDERLSAERRVLASADRLGRLSTDAYAELYDGENAALPALANVWRRLVDLAEVDQTFAPFLEEREAIKAQLEELAFVLRDYSASLDASPDRLQAVEDRLAAIERVKKRHGPTLTEVLARQQALREELAELGASDERAEALAERERQARDTYLAGARARSRVRHDAAGRLTKALEGTLAELAMPDSRVEVRIVERATPDAWRADGIDDVEFYLSPNPGEDLRPLARIASGGELSRVMLALRTLAATGAPGRTLVFDEVDAGIGGAAADAVGARLQALAARYQVVCITHLPQIAARAGTHFQIAKQVKAGRTLATVRRLDDAGRELEVARMIAGAEISSQVVASARELLASKRPGEHKPKEPQAKVPRAKAKGQK